MEEKQNSTEKVVELDEKNTLCKECKYFKEYDDDYKKLKHCDGWCSKRQKHCLLSGHCKAFGNKND